jgi:hypothetical protein
MEIREYAKVQRRWTREFETTPLTRLTFTIIRDKFEKYGTVNNMCKQRSGRPRTSTSEDTSAMVLQQFTRSPKTSSSRCAGEIGISKPSAHRILRTPKWKCYVPRLLNAMIEDDPDRRLECCEWIQRKVVEDAQFLGMVVWTDEATFRLNGTENRHNCVYWSSENPNVHVDKAVYLPGFSIWYGVSSRGVVGPFFFEGTVTGAAYLSMPQESTVPAVRQLYGDEDMWHQQDGAPPHYHRDVRAYLDNTFPDRWIGRRGFVESPPPPDRQI